MLLYLGALTGAGSVEPALFLHAALPSQGHLSPSYPSTPKSVHWWGLLRNIYLYPEKMKQTHREHSSKWLLCQCPTPKALEGREHLALALKDLSRKVKYGHSPGIWLGIFKGFPILLFFSLHIQYSWLLSGRKCGEVGEVWRTEGNWQKRKRMVYFLLSKGGTGKRWAMGSSTEATSWGGMCCRWVIGQRLTNPDV